MTHALIIGGGLAGATTALALGKAGIESTVYEAYPDGADDTGAFLMVMHNGLDALRAVDALDAIMPCSFRTTRVEHVDAAGQRVSGHTIGVTLTDVDGPRTLRRADLHRALQNEVRRRGGRIEHSKRLVRATTTGRRVIATFADGSRAEGDLLVGADGIRSIIRAIIDPAAPAPRYTGENVVFGYTRDNGIPPASETFRMIHGSSGLSGYTTSPNGETLWVVHLPGDEMTAVDRATLGPSDWRDRILRQVAGDDTLVTAIVRASGTNIMASSSYDVPSTTHWHTAHLVLVGDAAHAASPSAAQGASMALEDAVTLAQCLRDLPSIPDAFAAYTVLRRARVERLVAFSTKQPNGPSTTIRDNADPRAWLYSHHIEWDAPVTHRREA